MSRSNLQRVRVGALTTSRTAVFIPIAGIPQRRDVDMRSLPLGPLDAFVLSQVDGRATVDEIAAASSLSPAETHRVLHVLAERGAVDFAESGSSGVSGTRIRTPIG
jgi:IclR helix-turn-helix domain